MIDIKILSEKDKLKIANNLEKSVKKMADDIHKESMDRYYKLAPYLYSRAVLRQFGKLPKVK